MCNIFLMRHVTNFMILPLDISLKLRQHTQQTQNIYMIFLICHIIVMEKHFHLMFVQHYLNVVQNIRCFKNVFLMFVTMSIHDILKTEEESFYLFDKMFQ